MFETNSSSEWLLYISEWTQGNLGLSNIRVTTKVAVNALLGDTPALQDYGSAIMHNLATKEVKAAVCTHHINIAQNHAFSINEIDISDRLIVGSYFEIEIH